jgi:hypothetical protein
MALLALVCLSGCGNSRTPVPSLLVPAPAGGFRTLSYPAAGVSLAVPARWTVIREHAPLLIAIASGGAVISLWHYVRGEPLPATRAQLERARRALLAAIRARQPAVRVIRSRVLRIDQRPAVELNALERIGGVLRRVRSTHVFTAGGEVVLEEYAPARVFHQVDHTVFSPVRQSLQIIAS